ncbi:HORMA domain-containing protein 1 [Antennarius striatus]|uniref:HORMA domain-containing protein 1 n=1 Tax=Antennarius striatus TaxID=241820 RepID=UPI0035AE1792
MASLQKVRSSQESQLLPNEVLSEQESLVVMKKLLAIAVSGITYLRGLFPEYAYGNKYIEDQKVMILREQRNCPGASQVVQWMQGCFEAIQKKYLRTVILSIYTDAENPRKVTEFYQFHVQYTENGAQMDFESSDNKMSMLCGNTRRASILLVRKLYILMQNLGPLPDEVCLNMKLVYYQEVTPRDYHPPGFKEADGDSMEFEREPVKLTMGQLVTPYHTLKLDMATERHRLEQVEEGVANTERWVLSLEDGSLLQGHVIEDGQKTEDDSTASDNTEFQLVCEEKMESEEEAMMEVEVGGPLKSTSNVEVGLKRTRSGRIIRSTTEKNVKKKKKNQAATSDKMALLYEIQASPASPPAAKKKRKVSQSQQR